MSQPSKESEEEGERQRRLQAVFTWLEENHRHFLAYLRPMASSVAGLRGITPDEAARELLVETVEIAHEIAGSRYNPDVSESPRKWLVAIARNLVMRWREKSITEQNRRTEVPLFLDDDDMSTGDLFERLRVESMMTRATDAAALGPLWIQQSLAALKPDQAEVIRLRIIEDRPSDEVARCLNISTTNERVRLHRALEALRSALATEEARALGNPISLGRNDNAQRAEDREITR